MQNNTLNQLDTLLNTYLVKKAPAIPENIKEAIVKYGPYISLFLLVLSLPALLGLLGLTALLTPVSYLGGVRAGLNFSLIGLASIVSLVLNALALPGLFNRKLIGWNYLFYSNLVNAAVSLISLNFIGLIVGSGLSFYILYQVKSYYK